MIKLINTTAQIPSIYLSRGEISLFLVGLFFLTKFGQKLKVKAISKEDQREMMSRREEEEEQEEEEEEEKDV